MGTKNEGDPCYAAAMPDEPIFVLLARDPQAPDLIRKWAKDREAKLEDRVIYLGEGYPHSGRWEQPDAEHVEAERAKLAEARYCAARMEVWRYENDGKWREPAAPATLDPFEAESRNPFPTVVGDYVDPPHDMFDNIPHPKSKARRAFETDEE